MHSESHQSIRKFSTLCVYKNCKKKCIKKIYIYYVKSVHEKKYKYEVFVTSFYTAENPHKFKICRMFFYSFTYTAFKKKPRTIHNNIVLFPNLRSVEKSKWKKSLYHVKLKIKPEKILHNEPDQYIKSINIKLSNESIQKVSTFRGYQSCAHLISSHLNLKLLHGKL